MRQVKRYSPEALSCILTAHAGGLLVTAGRSWGSGSPGDDRGCVNQFAYNEADPHDAYARNPAMGHRFDSHYRYYLNAEELLKLLEE
jgi:hypothetical protein